VILFIQQETFTAHIAYCVDDDDVVAEKPQNFAHTNKIHPETSTDTREIGRKSSLKSSCEQNEKLRSQARFYCFVSHPSSELFVV
jgi:hypothetical protein